MYNSKRRRPESHVTTELGRTNILLSETERYVVYRGRPTPSKVIHINLLAPSRATDPSSTPLYGHLDKTVAIDWHILLEGVVERSRVATFRTS
ncbi:hypothetical protein AVEN_198207-1 [Araneus ventricosus]|uniref:Uncharacterized protein n=1 Tax=Araneus ventricosus TaxID=182803 RepID=A0A4Y2E5I1_ARAVE|nr:hypothetical protein AVEN_198207-1 [Araneus ventricosus]